MFAFDQQEFNFKPCTKLTVHFINEDHVRHQWMMHGLPKYLYPKGMFHLEVSGPAKISGTLILPPGDKTYLVHCDIAQHMEKGMKAELKVGKGDGDLPSIPGVTAPIVPDDYKATLPELMAKADAVAKAEAAAPPKPVVVPAKPAAPVPTDDSLFSGTTVIGLAIGLLAAPFLARKYKGMTVAEAVAYTFEVLGQLIGGAIKLFSGLISKKTNVLPSK
jgi:tetrahydromethanopterin S-methyltransferase subunit F